MIKYILIIILAVIGFFISRHIRKTKSENKALVCVVGKDCDAVVHSKYNKLLGVSNELWGMLYFIFIILAYGILLLFSSLVSDNAIMGLQIVTGGAALFSVFLIFIQAFIIKEWCEWCLVVASSSILIFLLTII